MKNFYARSWSFGLALSLISCAASDGASTSTPSTSTDTSDLPAVFSKFSDNVAISLDGDEVVLETDDIPNHSSPYFSEDDPLYEDPDAGMTVNPNRIAEQNYAFRIPLNPQLSSSVSETNLDAIGISRNGVVFFNQYAGRTMSGDWLPLDDEIFTFDRYNGHPAQQGNYHYHLEPLFLTAEDKTAFIGVMLDGFPIYGPNEVDGSESSGLDDCNGHEAATADYPDGIYHYHTTDEEPYLIGCYRGAAGTVSN